MPLQDTDYLDVLDRPESPSFSPVKDRRGVMQTAVPDDTDYLNALDESAPAPIVARTPTQPAAAPPQPAPETSSLLRQSIADPAISLLGKGVVGVSEAAVGLADIASFGLVGKAAESVGVDFQTTQAFFDSIMSPEMQADKKAVEEATGFLGTIKAALANPRVIPASVLESIPSMLGGQAIAGTAAVGGAASKIVGQFPKLGSIPLVAAAIGEGAISAGQMAESARAGGESGFLSPKDAALATASGAATALLGIMGGKLAARLGIADVDQLLVREGNKAVKKIVKEVVDPVTGKVTKQLVDRAKFAILRDVIAGAIAEGAFEELPQSLQEAVADNIMNGRPWGEGVAEQGALGMLSGMAMGAGGAAIGGRADPAQKQPPAEGEAAETGDTAPAAPLPTPEQRLEQENALTTLLDAARKPKAEGGREMVIDEGSVRVAESPDVLNQSAQVANELGEAMEVPIVWYEADEGTTLNAVNGTHHDGRIFLNVNAADPAQAVFTHELTHIMEGDADIYAPLKTAIDTLAKKGAKSAHTEKLNAFYERIDQQGAFSSDREFVADVTASFASDPTFFKELVDDINARGDATEISGVQKALTRLAEILDTIIAKVTGSENPALAQYIEEGNIQQVRDALRTALTEFAVRGQEQAQAQPEAAVEAEAAAEPIAEPEPAQEEETLPPPKPTEPAKPTQEAEKPIPDTRTQEGEAGEPISVEAEWKARDGKALRKALGLKTGKFTAQNDFRAIVTAAELDAARIAARNAGLNVAPTKQKDGTHKLRITHKTLGSAPGAAKPAKQRATAADLRAQSEFEGTLEHEAERGQIPDDDPAWQQVSKEFRDQYKGIGKSADKPFVTKSGAEAFRDAGVWRMRSPQGEWVTLSSRGQQGRIKDALDKGFPLEAEQAAPEAEGFAPEDDLPFSVQSREAMNLVTGSGRFIEVIKNPRPADYGRIKQALKRDFPNAPKGTPSARFTYDADGNRYIWYADAAIHSEAEAAIRKEIKSPVSQAWAPQIPFSVSLGEDIDALIDKTLGPKMVEHKLTKRLADAETAAGEKTPESIRKLIAGLEHEERTLAEELKIANKWIAAHGGIEKAYTAIMGLTAKTHLPDAEPATENMVSILLIRQFSKIAANAKTAEENAYWSEKTAEILEHIDTAQALPGGRGVHSWKVLSRELDVPGVALASLRKQMTESANAKAGFDVQERIDETKAVVADAHKNAAAEVAKKDRSVTQSVFDKMQGRAEKAEATVRKMTKAGMATLKTAIGTSSKIAKYANAFAGSEGNSLAAALKQVGKTEAAAEAPDVQFAAKETAALSQATMQSLAQGIADDYANTVKSLPKGQSIDNAQFKLDKANEIAATGNQSLIDAFDEMFSMSTAINIGRVRSEQTTATQKGKKGKKGKPAKLTPEQVRQQVTAKLTATKPQNAQLDDIMVWASLHDLTPRQGIQAWERVKEGQITWDTLAAGLTAAQLTPSETATGERTASQQRAARRATIRRIGLVRVTLADMNQRVSRLVKAHYSEQNAVLSTLIDRLKGEGMTQGDATRLANEIEAEFRALLKAESLRMLDKAFLRDDLKAQNIKEGAVARKLLEHLDAGALTNEKYWDAFSEAYGLPQLTPKMVSELTKLQQKAAKATEGRFRREAKRDILRYISKSIGSTQGKWWAVWYANILSALGTHERNVFDTGGEVMANLTADLIRPKNWWLAPFAYTGFVKGLRVAASAAKTTIMTGERPIALREKFAHQESILEANPFKGVLKPLNALKIVTRMLMAEDTMFAVAATEAKAYMLAAEIARTSGKDMTMEQIVNKTNQILNRTKAKEEAYAKQAQTEGLTGSDARLRVYELMTQKRGVHEVSYYGKNGKLRTALIDLENNPHSYGERVTYNYPAEGIFGAGARAWEGADIPDIIKKPMIPFTNIIANVLNAKLNYTPWAFIRARYGIKGEDGKKRTIEGQEKESLIAKGLMGSTAMTAMMMLSLMKMGEDDDEIPEEERKFAWFPDLHGGGPKDRGKGYQLRQSGWRPHSIRFGDTYWDYMLTPLAIPLSIIGNYLDYYRYDTPKEGKEGENLMQQATTYALMRNVQTITSLSFLSSITPLMGAIENAHENPEQGARHIQRFFARLASTTVPAANAIKHIDRAFNPTIRHAYRKNPSRQFLEYFMRETPVVSRALKPKINALGGVAKFDRAVIIGRHKHDRVWELIASRGIFIPKISTQTKFVNKDLMTDDQFYDYAKLAGQITRRKIEADIGWLERMSDERLKKRISKYAEDARAIAKRRIDYKRRGW